MSHPEPGAPGSTGVAADAVGPRPIPDGDPAHLVAGDPGVPVEAAGAAAAGRPAALSRWAPGLAPGLVALVLGLYGVATPGLWGDEFATWGAASLSWSQLTAMLERVDAVFAPYYAATKLWTALAGSSDTALRLPSVLAMAAAAALVGVLGLRLAGRRAGVISGVLFAALPVVSRYGQEARPYAFAVFATALACLLLLRLLERPGWWRAAGYAAAVLGAGTSHLVALLILPVHAVVVLGRRDPALTRRWAVAGAAAVVPLLPLIVAGFGQRQQVAWISYFRLAPQDYLTVLGGSVPGGVLVCVLASHHGLARDAGRTLLLAWALLPPAILLVLSPVMELVLPRYLLFVLPAWALLAGVALARLQPGRVVVAAGVLLALAVPQHVALRAANGHEYQASGDLAHWIGPYVRPGDVAVFAERDGTTSCCSWVARDALAHYLPAAQRPADVLTRVPQRTDGVVNAVEWPDPAVRLGLPGRIWVIRLGSQWDAVAGLGTAKEQLLRQGFHQVGVWYPSGFTVALLEPNPGRSGG